MTHKFICKFLTFVTLFLGSEAILADNNSTTFIGYARTGLGFSESGENQVGFGAPGAPVKYRLGNEADTFVELGVDYRFALPDRQSSSGNAPKFQLVAMVSSYAPFGSSNQLGIDNISQLYIKVEDVMANEADVWVGRRYYGRQEIHLNDYFWLNSGQGAHAGAGVENFELGYGKFHAAVFKVEDQIDGVGPTINTITFDFRHDGLNLGATGELGLWFYAAFRHENVDLNLDSHDGYGLGVWYQHQPIANASNVISLTHRSGAAIPQGKINPQPVREDQGFDLDEARRWEINNNFLYEPESNFAVHWTLIYRREESGVIGAEGDELDWLSSGIRPIYYLSDNLNVAFEYGFDQVENKRTSIDGSLHKGTVAMQFAFKRGYYTRPVLRLFATYAKWSDEFRGLVGTSEGNDSYANSTSGWNLGLQLEAWW